MSERIQIAVIGGGIAGLCSAIALRRAGFDVRVFERAPKLREVGAGITLWSNAIKALRELELDTAVCAAGVAIEHGTLRSMKGKVLVETPVGAVGRELGAPSVALRRADLQRLLVAAWGERDLELDAHCVEVRERDDEVSVRFENGREVRANLVIGADGIHSAVRSSLFGGDPVRYAGYTCWRAIVEIEHALCLPGVAFESWGPGARFGLVSTASRSAYWFCALNAPRGGRDGDVRAELLARFGTWHAPIRDLLDATPPAAIFRADILDLERLREWGRGRVTLLGDAAHATTPNLGQGACTAIEDAVVLARCLKQSSDTIAALRRYETLRKPRAAQIVARSRRLGWIGQLQSPSLCRIRDLCMRSVPDSLMRRAYVANVAHEL